MGHSPEHFSTPIIIFDAPKGVVKLNPSGLSNEQQQLLQQLAVDVFNAVKNEGEYILRRCNWFAETGYPFLEALSKGVSNFQLPRIVGCDFNPMDQHYWLEIDLVSDEGTKAAVIDPIFGYVGLKENSTTGRYYYFHEKTRTVPHGLSREDGGVRVNTFSI